jgi:hypothetical protein
VDFIAARVLDHLGIEHGVGRRWKSGERQGTGDERQGTGDRGQGTAGNGEGSPAAPAP